MSKTRTIFILGIWLAILPFLGFPSSWKKIILILTGLFLIYLAYQLEKKYKVTKISDQTSLYTQNTPVNQAVPSETSFQEKIQ